jgi:hypothetical protein
MILVVHADPDQDFLPIPDPGPKGSRNRIRICNSDHYSVLKIRIPNKSEKPDPVPDPN